MSYIDHEDNRAIVHQQIKKFKQQRVHFTSQMANRIINRLRDINPIEVEFHLLPGLLSASMEDWPAELQSVDVWILSYFDSDPFIGLMRHEYQQVEKQYNGCITKPIKKEKVSHLVEKTRDVFDEIGSRPWLILSISQGRSMLPSDFTMTGVKLLLARYLSLYEVVSGRVAYPILQKLVRQFNLLNHAFKDRTKMWKSYARKWLRKQARRATRSTTTAAASTTIVPTPMTEDDTLLSEVYGMMDDLMHFKRIMVSLLHTMEILPRLDTTIPAESTESTVYIDIAINSLSAEEMTRIHHTYEIYILHNSARPFQSFSAQKIAIAKSCQ